MVAAPRRLTRTTASSWMMVWGRASNTASWKRMKVAATMSWLASLE